MELPSGYEHRAPTAGDLDAIAHVFGADDLDDGGEIVIDADFLAGMWSREGFDPRTDAWVIIERLGAIVGYAQAMHDEPGIVESMGVVHPAHRRRGLGSWLLDQVEARAGRWLAPLSAPRFRHAINAGDRAAEAMLKERGLRQVRHFWHMGIDLEAPVDPGRSPEGIVIGAIDPRTDRGSVHAILTEAFAQDWGYHPEPFDRWAEDYENGPNYDPTLWLLANDGPQPVGALAAGDGGWIGEVGVLPSHRGRGIAGALLHRSFATFAARGVPRVMLNVDAENPTGATALYERVGMRILKRWDLWERSGPAPGGATPVAGGPLRNG